MGEPKDELWKTGDGKEIPVSQMTEDHAKNALRMMIRLRRRQKASFQAIIALRRAMKLLDEEEAETFAASNQRILDKVLESDAMWGKS